MSENVSTEFPNPPNLKPLTSLRSQVWRYASLALVVGGLVLMATGAWMFYQHQVEASKPAPRLVEVPPEDLLDVPPQEAAEQGPETLPSLSRQVELNPTAAPAELNRNMSGVNLGDTIPAAPTTSQEVELVGATDHNTEPASKMVISSEREEVVESQPEPISIEESKFLEEARLVHETAPTAGQETEAVPSLAGNPLVVVEDVAPSGEAVEASEASAARPTPTRIVAESIGLDSTVIEVGWRQVVENGETTNVWVVADFAAGWHQNSALPGEGGNIVLSGHHNIKGQVFRYLVDLEVGDVISLYSGDSRYDYVLADKFIVKDKGEPEAVRRANAKWIGPFNEERLTLVTCWPFNSNTHRLIVIAKPV